MTGRAAAAVPVHPGPVQAISPDREPQARPRFDALPPLSLYIHIPWCLRKCPYCDFNSHARPEVLPEQAYVEALVADLDSARPAIRGRAVHSIFIGGGTPSLFGPRSLDALLAAVRARVALLPQAEVTMEANPGTFEAERFAGYREAGVTRLSIGVQSFEDARLAAIGRVHGAEEAARAVGAALALFPEVNVDLMYGLPGQELEGALRDARTALALGASHVSAYHLTLEPNTLFHRQPPPLPGEDEGYAMQEGIDAALREAGLARYEVSAYARPGHECRHNLNYWRFGDYLGIGAGAHSKLSSAGSVAREVRFKHPARYLEAARAGRTVMERREIPPGELGFEFMLNALRLVEGFELPLFRRHTGLPLERVLRPLEEASRRGLLERDAVRARATPLGMRFLNDLQALFLD